ncbi:acetolactate synthase small subunit [Compostibacter hankyongensis]|uniref:Acetolactate synthase small subunit n=1 Tax=Compostibacter hankyongensis TaxID=1007089 RepID=A0ABP8G9E4_9BACT
MERQYTLTVYCENRIGLIGRVAVIFTRRHVNIESFIASETEIKDVYKLTVVVTSTREQLEKIVGQIEKLIEVHKAFVHDEEEVVYQEMALYKISTEQLEKQDVEKLIRANHANILSITPKYFVVEKTGHQDELLDLLHALEPYGLIEYASSGRVAIVKWSRRFHKHLKELSLVEEDNLSIGK